MGSFKKVAFLLLKKVVGFGFFGLVFIFNHTMIWLDIRCEKSHIGNHKPEKTVSL